MCSFSRHRSLGIASSSKFSERVLGHYPFLCTSSTSSIIHLEPLYRQRTSSSRPQQHSRFLGAFVPSSWPFHNARDVISLQKSVLDQARDVSVLSHEELGTQSWLAKPRGYGSSDDFEAFLHSIHVIVPRVVEWLSRILGVDRDVETGRWQGSLRKRCVGRANISTCGR